MKAVVQRVKKTSLSVDGKLISEIGFGLAIYLGIESGDTREQADHTAKKIANMRIFNDEKGRMNRSVLDEKGEILLISQFTLCADTSGGNRPSFVLAEEPVAAKEMYEYFFEKLIALGIPAKKGVFGADMQINQHNDGPVTIIMQNHSETVRTRPCLKNP